jgi:hypothetical protein
VPAREEGSLTCASIPRIRIQLLYSDMNRKLEECHRTVKEKSATARKRARGGFGRRTLTFLMPQGLQAWETRLRGAGPVAVALGGVSMLTSISHKSFR